jgi:hypothetical protein
MTNSYGEWKGFEIPKELLINWKIDSTI